MKLLYCLNCKDIVRLKLNEERYCSCGKVHGRYVDDQYAVYSGDPLLLGIDNNSFRYAFNTYVMVKDESIRFEAFIIPKNCKTFRNIEKDRNEQKDEKKREKVPKNDKNV